MFDTKKILLVEDDPSLGFVIKDNLTLKGYDVTLCKDGQEGEQAFLDNGYNLCIFDVMLPKKDGFSSGKKCAEKKCDGAHIISNGKVNGRRQTRRIWYWCR